MEVGDLEDEIETFFLRRNTTDKRNAVQQKSVPQKKYPIVPLLIQDILTADASNKEFTTAFQGSLQFKQCIIYGRIVGSTGSGKQCTKYTIEDGTGSIEVTVFNKNKEMQDLKRLSNKVGLCNTTQLKEPMHRILSVTEKLLDIFHLLPGTRVIVLGRPEIYREELCLISNNLFVDETIERKLEIAFKDSLIDYYLKSNQTQSNKMN